MALDFRKLKEQDARALEGVWMDYLDGTEKEGDKPTRFKISRPGKPFQAFVQAKLQALKKISRGADLEQVVFDPRMEPHTREAYARFVLIDWDNVIGDDGEPVPYSLELAKRVLQDADVMTFVRTSATDAETFREESQEADGKN